MKNPLFLKCTLLTLLGALLLIPLAMVENTIAERARYRGEAIQSIANASAGEQTLIGPVLTVPVVEEYDEEHSEEINGVVRKKSTRAQRSFTLTLLPRHLHIDGGLNVERRAYGLYATSVYEMQGALSGTFVLPSAANLPPPGPNSRLIWGIPTLSVGLSDVRGITGEPKIQLGDQLLSAERGVKADGLQSGFHADAQALHDGQALERPFRIDLRLVGTRSLGLIPVGDNSTAELRANWPHPSFGGDFLPRTREITAQDFTAHWSTTALASGIDGNTLGKNRSGFLVHLIDPVDIYQQALRAVKYGGLFIVLSFTAFFAYEHLRTLPIHPVQYLLVGLAQAIFFLLLSSLSEHIPFAAAYLAAAMASIALIGAYLTAVLHNWRRSLGFSGALAILYGALFGILRSEQNALLLGSLLLFIALAGLMLSTRRIDWYQLGKRDAAGLTENS